MDTAKREIIIAKVRKIFFMFENVINYIIGRLLYMWDIIECHFYFLYSVKGTVSIDFSI